MSDRSELRTLIFDWFREQEPPFNVREMAREAMNHLAKDEDVVRSWFELTALEFIYAIGLDFVASTRRQARTEAASKPLKQWQINRRQKSTRDRLAAASQPLPTMIVDPPSALEWRRARKELRISKYLERNPRNGKVQPILSLNKEELIAAAEYREGPAMGNLEGAAFCRLLARRLDECQVAQDVWTDEEAADLLDRVGVTYRMHLTGTVLVGVDVKKAS